MLVFVFFFSFFSAVYDNIHNILVRVYVTMRQFICINAYIIIYIIKPSMTVVIVV